MHMPAAPAAAQRDAPHVVTGPVLARAAQGGLRIELRAGEREVRLLVRRPGCGGLALEVPLFGRLGSILDWGRCNREQICFGRSYA